MINEEYAACLDITLITIAINKYLKISKVHLSEIFKNYYYYI